MTVTATGPAPATTGPVPSPLPGLTGALPPSPTVHRLRVALVVLLGLGFAAGIAGIASVQSRAGQINEMTTRDAPLVVTVQDLYGHLSGADATVASAFLTDGPEPPALRERYLQGIAEAAAALARIGSGVNQGPAAEAVAELTVQLPIYTGLVETARAYHREGLPLGAAYLREASGVMRDRLLPAAERLLREVSTELGDARAAAAGFPVLATLLGLATLAALVVVQIYLARRTRRVFNPGLVLATVAAVAALVWLGASAGGAAGHLTTSERDGSALVEVLAQARITALQARSDEAHTLVALGAGAGYEESFQTRMTALTGTDRGLLAAAEHQAGTSEARGAVQAARAAATRWQEVHAEVSRLDQEAGDHAAAVELAIGDGDSAAAAADELDRALSEGIASAAARLTDEAGQAGGALGGVGAAVAVLTGLLLLGVAVGIQRRLAEYR